MGGLWQDLRHAARLLGKKPGVPAIMVFTLALGIGATTAIFSVVYGVLLRPLPYPDANRIMAVFEVTSKGRPSRLADPNFDDFRDQNRSFQAIAKYSDYVVSVSGASQPTRTTVAHVSPDFLKVFGVQPILGRDFTASDAKKGPAPPSSSAIGYWRQYLGSPRDLSQSHLKIDGAVFSVIGVLPAGFRFPAEADLWLPADLDGENPSRTSHNYSAVGRLRDGVTVEQANRDISAIARRIHEASSEQGDYLLKDGMVIPLQDAITGKARSALLVLLGAVGFLLLVACANVANLLLAQASARERELAIRSALGAARGRLIRQFLDRGVSALAGRRRLGVLGALAGVAGLVALAPDNLPRLESVSISIPVLVVRVPALHRGRRRPRRVHRRARDFRGPARGPRGRRARAGGLAGQPAHRPGHRGGADRDHAGARGRRGIARAQPDEGARGESRVPRGQDRHDGRLASVGWTIRRPRPARRSSFRNLIDRLKQIPGVRKVGATSGLPLDGGLPDGMFLLMTPERGPEDHGRLRRALPAEGAHRQRGLLRRRPTATSRSSEFRWFAGASSTSATARTLRTWP